MLAQLPETVLPDWVTELATTTPMYEGTLSGGWPLLPVRVVKLVPQTPGGLIAGSVVTFAAKPLNEAGAVPPERLLRLDHEWLPQVTVPEPGPPGGGAAGVKR